MKYQTRLLSLLMAFIMAFSCAGVVSAADDDAMTGEEDIENDEETEIEAEPINEVIEEEPVEEEVSDGEGDSKEVLPKEDELTVESDKTVQGNGNNEDNEDAGDYGIATYASSSSNPTTLSTNGTWTDATLASSGQSGAEWYKITVPSDGEVKVQLMSYVNGTFCYMYTEDMSQTIGNFSAGGSSSSPGSNATTWSVSKGSYLIKLYANSAGKNKIYVKFTSYGVGHTEASTYDSPLSYTFGETAKGALTSTVRDCWYKIKIPSKGSYTLKVTNSTGSHMCIKLFDQYLVNEETYMVAYSFSGTVSSTMKLDKGTYYLHMWGPTGSYPCGKYSFSVKGESVSKPTISSAKNTSSGIKLTWKKISNAKGYYVYRKTGSGSYSKIKTISSKSTVNYTDKSAKNGKTYTYKVIAYSSNNKSSGATKKAVRLTTPSVKSVKNSSSKKATVKWKKKSSVSGYQIQYSTKKSFSSKKTVTAGKSKTSKKLTKLKKGKTYYVRIRSYKTVSGKKYYSAWSSKKSVKIKK